MKLHSIVRPLLLAPLSQAQTGADGEVRFWRAAMDAETAVKTP